MVYTDSVLFYHALLIEGLDLLLLEPLVVLLIKLGHLRGYRHLFFFEVVDQICDQRSHLFLLMECRGDEVDELV